MFPAGIVAFSILLVLIEGCRQSTFEGLWCVKSRRLKLFSLHSRWASSSLDMALGTHTEFRAPDTGEQLATGDASGTAKCQARCALC